MNDDEWLDRHARRSQTRRWNAWWTLRNRSIVAWLHLKGFIRRAPWVGAASIAGVGLGALLSDGVPWDSIGTATAVLAVFFVVDQAGQAVQAADRRRVLEVAQLKQHIRELNDSIPMLATGIVEEHMEALGYRRRARLLMGDVAYDAQTGDPMDMRDPTQMWEKI